MSQRYSVTIDIDAPYNKKTIQSILEKGLQLGMLYYRFMDYGGRVLDAEKAADWCMEKNEELSPHCLTTKIEGVYVNLHLIDVGGWVTVMLTDISYEKLKKFKDNTEGINIGIYAKAVLDFVQDYKIFEMRIEKD